MIEIRPPTRVYYPATSEGIFLAGSIENDSAERWQDYVVNALRDTDLVILNPRRSDWNPSWNQSKDDSNFSEQVNWELDGLENADMILFYFSPDTKSPISLMELGFVAAGGCPTDNIWVVCPEGFWRKGNIDIMCYRYGLHQVNTLDEAIAEIRTRR